MYPWPYCYGFDHGFGQGYFHPDKNTPYKNVVHGMSIVVLNVNDETFMSLSLFSSPSDRSWLLNQRQSVLPRVRDSLLRRPDRKDVFLLILAVQRGRLLIRSAKLGSPRRSRSSTGRCRGWRSHLRNAQMASTSASARPPDQTMPTRPNDIIQSLRRW